MTQHYPVLVVVIPLLSAFIIFASGWIRKGLCFPIALGALAASALCAIGLLAHVLQTGPVQYELAGWLPPWGIAYWIDHLNALVLVLVSLIALLNLVASHGSIEQEYSDRIGAFYSLYILFVTGLLGIVATGDLFNLYVLLEVASLTGYALIAMGPEPAPLASLNYVFMGTIGACFYLLGIGYLYIITGSLNIADIASILPELYHSRALLVAFFVCMVGIWVKMAFFPLHTWLPNAYSYAPSPAASLIAPLMTKVMAYVMIRLMISLFSVEFTFDVLEISRPMVWLSCLAIVMGAFLALTQTDIKRMFTYIIVSEVGYMVGGAWLGNRAGMTGAMLHIMNDALMTFCLFLAAAALRYRLSDLNRYRISGMFRKMPFTMAALVGGGLSIIGVPPTCGFFSKWYLISGGLEAGHYGFVVALILSSLISAVLFFRIIEIGFFQSATDDPDHGRERLSEAPVTVLIPLLIVTASLLVVGMYTGKIVTGIIEPVLQAGIG